MIAQQLRRLAEAIRAGEYTGDVAEDLALLAAEAEAERVALRREHQDALGKAALRSQKSGNSEAAEAFLAAAGMVS